MKRHTIVSLFISLTLVSMVFGTLPLAAAGPSSAPAAVTETFTPAPTDTSAPTATNTSAPTATNTSAPTATNTSAPAPTNTSAPAPADTSAPAPTQTIAPVATWTSVPTVPAVVGVPDTGGAAPQAGPSLWIWLLALPIVGSILIMTLGLRVRARRRPSRR